MLKLKNVTKVYNDNKSGIKDINVNFKENSLNFILGPSGSGKSTLLNLMSSIEKNKYGEISYCNKDISKFNNKSLDNYRRNIVSQIYQNFNILEDKNVYENIEIPLKLKGISKEEIKKNVLSVLNKVNLDGYQYKNVNNLSGGELQRVAIARAIINKPKILLCDEPTGNLDEKNAIDIISILKGISNSCLVIVVTHNERLLNENEDRIIRINDGKIIEDIDKNNNNLKDITRLMSDEEILYNTKKYLQSNTCIKLTNDDVNYVQEENKLKKLSLKYMIHSACKDIFKYKLRVFTLILISFTTLILSFISMTAVIYNSDEVLLDYLNTSNVETIGLKKEIECYHIDLNGEKHLIDDKCDEEFTNDLYEETKEIFGENVSRSYDGFSSREYQKSTDFIEINYNILDENLESLNKVQLLGDIPKNNNEVLITDYMARNIFGPKYSDDSYIGMELEISSYILDVNKAYVSGVIKTNYLEEEITDITDKNSLIYQQKVLPYTKIFAHHSTIENIKKVYVDQDFRAINGELDFRSNFTFYNSKDFNLNENNIHGRLPIEYDEVMISSTAIEEEFDISFVDLKANNMSEEEKEIIFGILSNKQYFENSNNINDYSKSNFKRVIPDGFKIVGIFYEDSVDEYSILSNNQLFMEIGDEALADYLNGILLFLDDYENLISNAHDNSYRLNNFTSDSIYQTKILLSNVSQYILIINIVIFVLSVLIFTSFMSTKIRNEHKKIGILRSLGTSKRDVFKIYLIQALIISLLTIILAVLTIIIGFIVVNNIGIKEGLEYRVLHFSGFSFAILILVGIVTCVLSVMLPIRKLNKQNPLKTIKF